MSAAAETTSRRRWSALAEIALYIGGVFAADAIWGSGARFAQVQPHPFWGIVLLMAVQYGTAEALAATLASSVALLAGNMPAQSLSQSIHDYTLQVLLSPLLWMSASLVLGELRMRQKLQQAETEERLTDTERQVELLTKAHEAVAAAKDRLETRLAGQMRTATGLFESARLLETLEPSQVMAGAIDLVGTALQAKSFSLYLLDGDALVLAASRGEARRALTERVPGTAPLFQAVVGSQHIVSVASPLGEDILDGAGLIAGPLIDPASGRLVGMLKIEEMQFLDFNLSNLRTFKVLCEWVGAAYANALAHQSSQLQDHKTHLYGMKYLDRQADYVTELAARFDFDLTLLYFKVDVEQCSADDRQAMPAMLGEAARQVLRRTDMVFGLDLPGTQFAVLLPGALPDNVSVVALKLQEALAARCGHAVPCTSSVRSLHRAGNGPLQTPMGAGHKVA